MFALLDHFNPYLQSWIAPFSQLTGYWKWNDSSMILTDDLRLPMLHPRHLAVVSDERSVIQFSGVQFQVKNKKVGDLNNFASLRHVIKDPLSCSSWGVVHFVPLYNTLLCYSQLILLTFWRPKRALKRTNMCLTYIHLEITSTFKLCSVKPWQKSTEVPGFSQVMAVFSSY